MSWADRDDALRAFVEQGLSATQIARQFGDVSRNAVIGRLHRLGLTSHGQRSNQHRAFGGGAVSDKPIPRRHGGAKKIVAVSRLRERERVAEPEPVGPPRELIDGCKWIHGDVLADDWRQCGAARESGTSWCAHHLGRVFQAPDRAPQDSSLSAHADNDVRGPGENDEEEAA